MINPFMPTVASNICCPRDCVSRYNGGTRGAPIMSRDAVSRTANVGCNGGQKWVNAAGGYAEGRVLDSSEVSWLIMMLRWGNRLEWHTWRGIVLGIRDRIWDLQVIRIKDSIMFIRKTYVFYRVLLFFLNKSRFCRLPKKFQTEVRDF